MKKGDFYLTKFGGRDDSGNIIYSFVKVSGWLTNMTTSGGHYHLQFGLHRKVTGEWTVTEISTGLGIVSGAPGESREKVLKRITPDMIIKICAALDADKKTIDIKNQLSKHLESANKSKYYVVFG